MPTQWALCHHVPPVLLSYLPRLFYEEGALVFLHEDRVVLAVF